MMLLEAKRTMKDAIAWVYDESGSRQVPPFVEAALKDGVKAIESIIRCKDCKRYESDGGALMTCTLHDLIVDDDCFCWWGERREE